MPLILNDRCHGCPPVQHLKVLPATKGRLRKRDWNLCYNYVITNFHVKFLKEGGASGPPESTYNLSIYYAHWMTYITLFFKKNSWNLLIMAQPTNADPGHTTMVYHQQTGQISQQPIPATPRCSESYNGISGRATGWIQLCCAVGVTLIGVAQFLLGSSLRFIACGIWMSLLVGERFENNNCKIVIHIYINMIQGPPPPPTKKRVSILPIIRGKFHRYQLKTSKAALFAKTEHIILKF